MEASVVDLRYKMREVLNALEKRERVNILYHGKIKGVIVPVEERSEIKVADHPFFGISSREKKKVEQVMDSLREGRYRDI